MSSAHAQLPRHLHTGVCPPARGAVLARLMRAEPDAPVWLVVAPDLKLAEQLAEDTAFFHQLPVGSLLAGAFDSDQRTTSNARASSQPTERTCVHRTLDALVFPESMGGARDMAEAFAASADRQTVLSRLRATRSQKTEVRSKKPSSAPSPISDRPSSIPLAIFTTPGALLQSVPALADYAAKEFTLTKGQTHPFADLLQKLADLDYDHEPVCEAPGHYAVRGGIIDVYPVTANQPYRLDFFGDELEDIRAFDPVTQRSGESIPELTLAASPRLQFEPARTGLADYLAPSSRLVLVDPATLDKPFSDAAREGFDRLTPILQKVAAAIGLADLDEAAALFDPEHVPSSLSLTPSSLQETTWDTDSLRHHRHFPSDGLVAQDRLAAEDQARKEFIEQLALRQKNGATITFVASKEGEEQRAREILAEHKAFKKPHFIRGHLNEGFRLTPPPVGRLLAGAFTEDSPAPPPTPNARASSLPTSQIFVTETELFGRQRARRAGGSSRALVQRAQVDQLLDFSELVEGDFVVHLQHGIATYRGLTKLETRDGHREVISLEFDDHVTLHVPLQESHLISRYVGLSKTKPQLGKIGSGRWEKARKAAEVATIDLAAELLRIHAAREAQPGHACPPDNDWQHEFESSFPYAETKDQLTAIQATKVDMERTRPMDRLICGDVGFGKTEVAIRAAFKAVQSGRQVALLVPTTILAQQHLNTFRERMAGYPIAVEMVSRFRTRAETNRIVAATAAGQVDILIGTHRILNKDIAFKDLGLVIIDEEQRFGVKHKERLKSLRTTVDVLSMSATPIPRTLYMAMTGARDMSVIETAPTNRHPIETIVKTYDEKLVIDAVRHELRRGGQVFYLHNRVQTINLVAARLSELLPDVKIGVGHGQMDEHDLERVMTEFVAGEYQVLVCTTIIETGLDIPNCNTIIIEGADRFGLSQLYQLRGRVGRFKHQAYAYLLLHRHTRVVEVARERLTALRTHNQLGAGFRIAMRDLELRGAGNLLGAQQSGHIVGVGFELYCQLLRQSVARLKGEKHAALIRAAVKLDFVFVGEADTAPVGSLLAGAKDVGIAKSRGHGDGYQALKEAEQAASGIVDVEKIQARLPAAYIGETRLRIDLYRRLALAENLEALKQVETDLRDRFGKFANEVRALLLITEIRIRAEAKGILSVETKSNQLKCQRNTGKPDDYVMVGTRFPRLTAPKPLARLKEIITFLNNL